MTIEDAIRSGNDQSAQMLIERGEKLPHPCSGTMI